MTEKNQSLLLAVVTILCWASIATLGQLLLHLPPFFTLGVSFLLGGLPALVKPRELFPSWKITLWGIAGYFGYHFFLFTAFRFAPALEANLINYLWPVIMVLLTPVFFREQQLRWFHLLGGILSVVGCVFLMMGKGASMGLSSAKGYGLALLAAVTWPIYSIGKKKLPSTSVFAVGGFCLGAGLLCLLTHFWLEPSVELRPGDLWRLLLMGAGPFGIAFYFWDIALRKGDPKVIGALAYLTPVLSTAGLILFAGQELTPVTGGAMILIIGGASTGLLDFLPSKG